MNSNTTLSIRPLAKDSRVGCLVSLTLGEILVHVEHDGNPFVVATPHGKALIAGTTFNIKATNNTTTLAVARGSVQFGTDITFVEVLSGRLSKIIGQSAPTTPVLCDAAKLTAWATRHKTERILAQIAQPESYSDASELPQSSSGEPIVSDQETDGVITAAELLEQAHKHDAAYALGAGVNRPKALSLYQSALAAGPDQKQRLHVLYRMAQ
ncbi:MAG: FecR domain-containing protein, partial [Planctomycetota bacterium]